VRYWKPIQTGAVLDDDTAEVARLSGCEATAILARGVRLPRPVSPHLAARLAGVTIDLEPLLDTVQREPSDTRWIVEGAGGALVPLNDTHLMVDLMVRLGLPVLIVARTALGTINHTLLTLEALRSRRLDVAGVLMVGPASPANREAIELYGRVPVVGEMPPLEPLTRETLGRWASVELDCAGHLVPLLR
jgi:dethiobiotin synthase